MPALAPNTSLLLRLRLPVCPLPLQLLGVLRPLQPRLYSISSTPLEYSPPNSGVAATIAVVRYTSLNRERQGVASTQVCATRLCHARSQSAVRAPGCLLHGSPACQTNPHTLACILGTEP
jgi:sulfite reductase alpha subunit-like flavoprotein